MELNSKKSEAWGKYGLQDYTVTDEWGVETDSHRYLVFTEDERDCFGRSNFIGSLKSEEIDDYLEIPEDNPYLEFSKVVLKYIVENEDFEDYVKARFIFGIIGYDSYVTLRDDIQPEDLPDREFPNVIRYDEIDGIHILKFKKELASAGSGK